MFNTHEILVELTAIRLALQFDIDRRYAGAPRFDEDAELAVNGATPEFLKATARKQPYQPDAIIYPDYEAQSARHEARDNGSADTDDTADMLEAQCRAAFRNEYGQHAIMTLDAESPMAVEMYSNFKQLYFANLSKTGGLPNGQQ